MASLSKLTTTPNESSGHLCCDAATPAFTLRRLILTVTPLQNNMSECHYMVSFVKPNLLGTNKEFNNRFMNSITYGQEANASLYMVRLMKKRVHILNKLLAGCVHRCDYSHLTPYLPAKFEYIISIELSELQKKLYRWYLKYIGVTKKTTREDLRTRLLLNDYQVLKMVWSYPGLSARLQNCSLRDPTTRFKMTKGMGKKVQPVNAEEREAALVDAIRLACLTLRVSIRGCCAHPQYTFRSLPTSEIIFIDTRAWFSRRIHRAPDGIGRVV